MLLDLRLAGRSLFRRRGLFALAVLDLGLGIGATAVVVSLVSGVLLRPLPYRASPRMGVLWHQFGDHGQNLPAVHPADYRDYQARSRLIEEFTILGGGEWMLGGEAGAELVDVGLVGANFFRFLGVDPRLGRHFLDTEDAPGAPPVVLLGHELWARRFGSDPGIIGQTVEFDEGRSVVIGVLPPDFGLFLPPEAFFLRNAQVWRPARIDYANLPPRNWTSYSVFARLRPGVAFAAAQEELGAIAAQLREEHPEHASAGLRVRIVPLRDDVVKGARRGLLMLLAAVGLVLTLACVNVAILLLARGQDREREFLLRAALGASRGRIAQAVLAEGVVIAAGGVALGLLLAPAGLALVRRIAAQAVPRLDTVAIDGTVLACVAGVSVLTALVFGALPALRAARTDLTRGIEQGARGSASLRRARARDLLVMGQFALAFVLVVGAGLASRGFSTLANVDPGFEPRRLLTLRLALPRRFPNESSRYALYRRLRDRLESLPGVSSVAATSLLPLRKGPPQPFAYDERTARDWESIMAEWRRLGPGFFSTMGATVLAGREFTSEDLASGARRILIDDTLARLAFPGRSPVGQRLQLEAGGGPDAFAEIVGVVAHLDMTDLAAPAGPQFYEPTVFERSRFSLVIRTAARPEDLAVQVHREIAALEPDLVVEDVRPMDEIVTAALGPARLARTLMSLFGTFSVVLAALGVYGAFSYSVRQQIREIAIRMALGEAPAAVRHRVLTRGLGKVGLGLLLGASGSLLLTAFGTAWWHGVGPADPSSYAGAALLLAGVGLGACWFPAERAAQVDPVSLLRQD